MKERAGHSGRGSDHIEANPALGGSLRTAEVTAPGFRHDLFRPFPGWFQHRTPLRGLYLGGASTHAGAGVHGGAGANAARVLLFDQRLRWIGATLGARVAAVSRWLPHLPHVART